jgi:hypothetical protein
MDCVGLNRGENGESGSPETQPSPGVLSSAQTGGCSEGSQDLRSQVFSSEPPAHGSGPKQ